MNAMVLDLARARIARLNGERSLVHLWVPGIGPMEAEDFQIGDKVRFRDGKVGTILCFGAGTTRSPLMALVTVNGTNYTCPVTDLRSAS